MKERIIGLVKIKLYSAVSIGENDIALIVGFILDRPFLLPEQSI